MFKKLKPIMFAGTGSDVGKSIIATAFCRIFKQDGHYPAPFKAQNMALNSYATKEGLEIGRAQAVQAEAAGIDCTTDMNPILLKPTSDNICQVILNGKPIGNQNAYQYFKTEGREKFRTAVHTSFDRLNKQFNPIIIEGAGSISEINLRDTDLVNMSMAIYAKANVILIANIDTGGVFASIYGSIMLLPEEEKKYIKGIIINKFRGDINLFKEGIKIIENLCKVPVIGVIPYYKDIYIEEEDSVILQRKNLKYDIGKINIAIVLLKHISNFTDFNTLEQHPNINLFYTNNPSEISNANIIIIPGSKNTISDLLELRINGVAKSIIQAHKNGATIIGICGGYQIMGQEICDPNHIEGDIDLIPGLGLLPTTTTITNEKITRQIKFNFLDKTSTCEGYEIHMGKTTIANNSKQSPLNTIIDGRTDGYFINEKCFATYIHGILDNQEVIDYILKPFSEKLTTTFNYKEFKENQYNKLAEHIRKHIDIDLVYDILK